MMPADVRINDVTTDITATDASALLTPQMMECIVKVVLERVKEELRSENEGERERTVGALLRQESN